jgi:hypothetical protein
VSMEARGIPGLSFSRSQRCALEGGSQTESPGRNGPVGGAGSRA